MDDQHQDGDLSPRASTHVTSVEQSVHALLARTPELIPLLGAAAAWLARVVASAEARATSVEVMERPTASAPDPSIVEPSPRAEAGIEGGGSGSSEAPPSPEAMRALLDKFAGPAVAPRVGHPATSPGKSVAPPIDPDADLPRVRRHVSLQQAAIRWRASKDASGTKAARASYAHLRERGEQERCFMWALDPSVEWLMSEQLTQLREWYEVLGEAIDAYLDEESDIARSAASFEHLAMVVQATSRAIGVLSTLGLRDQGLEDLRHWLRRNARRFDLDGETMPSAGARSFEDAAAARQALEDRRDDARQRADRRRDQKSARNKFVYELKRFLDDPEDAEPHVRGMQVALDDLRKAGGSSNQRDFVEQVAGVLGTGSLPSSVMERSDGRELAMSLAGLHDELTDDSEDLSGPTNPEIARVREVLRGKTVVLIGGDERPLCRERIERAFELAELRWVATRPHETHSRIVPALSRPDVDVVILLIRWASHSYGDLRNECERCDKPFVRLPGGYNPSTIAHAFVQQVGRRFGLELP